MPTPCRVWQILEQIPAATSARTEPTLVTERLGLLASNHVRQHLEDVEVREGLHRAVVDLPQVPVLRRKQAAPLDVGLQRGVARHEVTRVDAYGAATPRTLRDQRGHCHKIRELCSWHRLSSTYKAKQERPPLEPMRRVRLGVGV